MSVVTDRQRGDGERARTAGALSVQPPRVRRRRVPEIALAVLLMAGFGLGALALATTGRERTPVLRLVEDVSRGEVITESDLATVHVGSDADIAALGEGEEDAVVGRAALTDLQAGTLLTPEQVGEPVEVLRRGAGVVGLALEAGQLPSLDLAPGDRVSVVAGGAAGGEDSDAGVVIDAGEVVLFDRIGDADQPGGQRRWWVAIRAGEGSATEAAGVVASGADVQLVLVSRASSEASSSAARGGL